MYLSGWLPIMSLLTTTAVTPVDKIESKPRPQVQRYSIEQLFATRFIGGADWSPDGKRVVVITNISGRNNLWIVPAAGGGPTQLTVSDQRQAVPAWSPDGRWIAFQSDHDADEQWDLFVVDPNNRVVFNLTGTDTISEEDPVWSPDSKWIAYAVKPKTAPNYEIHLWDMEAGRGGQKSRALTQGTPADWSLSPVAFVPGGKWLLANREHATEKDADVVLVSLAGGEVRNLTTHGGEQRWLASDVSPDGAWVLLTSNAGNGFDNVALLDLRAALAASQRSQPSGTTPAVTWITEERWEMEAGDFSPDGQAFTWQANLDGNGEIHLCRFRRSGVGLGSSTLGTTGARGDRGTIAGSESLGPRLGDRVRLATGSGYNTLAGRSGCFSPDGRQLLHYRSAADSPGDLHVYELSASRSRPITQGFVTGVDPADMVEPYLVRFPSRDGLEISGFLYVPWNIKRDRTNPALVWPHGGPTSQSVNNFNRQVQFFANHGYIVLTPNYRGSTGYGKEFMDANRFDMGGGDLADVVEGAHFLERSGFVDPAKIAVGGGSYGGYLTMAAVTQSPQTWAGGVALFPFVNWFTEVEHEDPLLRQYDLATMGNPVKDAQRYRDRSPIFFVDRIRAPLMLVAGKNDPRCPPDESRQVAEAMKKLGRTCEFVLYEDEGHGFARRENLFDAYRRIVRFLDRRLKGEKEQGAR